MVNFLISSSNNEHDDWQAVNCGVNCILLVCAFVLGFTDYNLSATKRKHLICVMHHLMMTII